MIVERSWYLDTSGPMPSFFGISLHTPDPYEPSSRRRVKNHGPRGRKDWEMVQPKRGSKRGR